MAILLGSGAPKVNFYCYLHYFNIRSTYAIYYFPRYWEGCLTPGFEHRRNMLNMKSDCQAGGLLYDKFTGNDGNASGQQTRRELWQRKNNVTVVEQIPGGGSAKGQPCDAAHAHWRRLTDKGESQLLGLINDVVQRQRLEALLKEVDDKSLTPKQICLLNLYCWEAMPPQIMRWAWTSRGLASYEDMARMHNCTVEEIYGDEAYMNTIHKSKPYVELPSDPIPMPVQGPLEIPQHQVNIIWLISESPCANKAEVTSWCSLPSWLYEAVDRELATYASRLKQLKQKLAEKEVTDPTPKQLELIANAKKRIDDHLAHPDRMLYFNPSTNTELSVSNVRQRKLRGTLNKLTRQHILGR